MTIYIKSLDEFIQLVKKNSVRKDRRFRLIIAAIAMHNALRAH